MAVKEKDLTPWFPASVKPARKGVYEVDSTSDRAFSYWNGTRFGWRTWMFNHISIESAVSDAFCMRHAETCLAERERWRGLNKDPK